MYSNPLSHLMAIYLISCQFLIRHCRMITNIFQMLDNIVTMSKYIKQQQLMKPHLTQNSNKPPTSMPKSSLFGAFLPNYLKIGLVITAYQSCKVN